MCATQTSRLVLSSQKFLYDPATNFLKDLYVLRESDLFFQAKTRCHI